VKGESDSSQAEYYGLGCDFFVWEICSGNCIVAMASVLARSGFLPIFYRFDLPNEFEVLIISVISEIKGIP
jgi:hypothetical protein